jgi:hypothetical protein
MATSTFFVPVTAVQTENVEPSSEGSSAKENMTVWAKLGQSPIILRWESSLISFQRELRKCLEQEVLPQPCNRITTESIADYRAILSFLIEKLLPFFASYTKEDKLVKSFYLCLSVQELILKLLLFIEP